MGDRGKEGGSLSFPVDSGWRSVRGVVGIWGWSWYPRVQRGLEGKLWKVSECTSRGEFRIHLCTRVLAVCHTYKVTVHTGDRPGGGTSAGVHMTMCGGPQSGHSGKLWLDNGQRAFLPGQSDIFVVTSPVLVSPLESLTIGHDSTGPSPGWFLEEVRIIKI